MPKLRSLPILSSKHCCEDPGPEDGTQHLPWGRDGSRLDRGQGGGEKLTLVDPALEAQARCPPSQLHRGIRNVPGRRGGDGRLQLPHSGEHRVHLIAGVTRSKMPFIFNRAASRSAYRTKRASSSCSISGSGRGSVVGVDGMGGENGVGV